MIRHHAEPNITLLTRNLIFDSDVRQLNHPLIIPLHCLWTKSNNRTRGQFECGLTWFYFGFILRCSCYSIVSLLFQVEQIKQVDCKTSTKNVNNCK